MTQKDGHDSQRDAGQGSARKVAVYGATGHTGRLVVGELLRRGFHPIAVARAVALAKASAYLGAVALGFFGGMLVFLLTEGASLTATHADRASVDALLSGKGVQVFTFADWQALDAHELAQGQAQDRPRHKVVHREEMLTHRRK